MTVALSRRLIVGPQPPLLRIMELVRLDTFIPCHTIAEQALKN